MAEHTDEDRQRISDIVAQHMDKNFVRRIADPTSVPSYNFDDGTGQTGTHLMSYSTNSPDPAVDKGAIVYPMIVQDEKTGQLKKFADWREAQDHAVKTGEFIPFDKTADADWFGKNYKANWKPEVYDHFRPKPFTPVRTPLKVTAP
jgi:hypothetical protein